MCNYNYVCLGYRCAVQILRLVFKFVCTGNVTQSELQPQMKLDPEPELELELVLEISLGTCLPPHAA